VPRRSGLRNALIIIIAVGCGLTPSCYDDADLEGAERELGDLAAGGASFLVTAELVGRYRRERRGGGRATYSCTTSDEIWKTKIGVTPSNDAIELRAMGELETVGNDRSDEVDVLEALELERCPGPDDSTVVFRVVGLGDTEWRVLYALGDTALTGPIEADAADCATASATAPAAVEFLGGIWQDGVLAWAGLDTLRETQPGAGATTEQSRRMNDGEAACAQLLALGEAREALRCGLSLRAWASQPAGEPLVAAIREGADAEAALFELAAPDGMEMATDPGARAVMERHVESTIRAYLAAAPTPERRMAFFDANVERCSVAPSSCERWRLGALGEIAHDAEDDARCDRLRDVARLMIEDAEAPAATALTLLETTSECGSEDTMRAAAMVGLSRPTLADDDTGGRGRCTPRNFGGPGDFRTGSCASLPRYAGEWLGRHCTPEVVARAVAILEATPGAEGSIDDGPTDGAARILASCDRPALDAFIEARDNDNLRVLTADY